MCNATKPKASLESRRNFLKNFGLSAAALSVAGLGSVSRGTMKKSGQPNVVIVITDDQGYGDLACHGNKVIQTPNLDKLHAESVRLTNYHVSPTCAPTRSALMTGHYCNATGVWHTIMGRSLLRKGELTLGDAFSRSDYRTGAFGKWHLGDNYPFRPMDRGFQETLVNGGGGVTQLPDYWGNDYFDDTYFKNSAPAKQEGYCTDVWFDAGMRFIEKNKDRPFFCYITTNAPHGPFNVDPKYIDLYKGKENVPNANFYGMITNIDENMGQLVKKLRDLDLEENTILIFTTDNGTAAGYSKNKGFNDGMRGTKGSEYEGGHRVPCFIRWPKGGLSGGKDISRLTAHIDVLPTLIDICGLKELKGIEFDGKSIKPLLMGDGKKWPDRAIVTDSQRIEHPDKWRKSAVMTDQWRLVNGKELYDINKDPGQKNDIAAKNPQVVAKLRDAYDKWWDHVSVKFDEYCEIIIGTEHENPTRITSHDWHGKSVPWNQNQVRGGTKANGFWAIEVARAGNYEISLRRWPEETNTPITGSVPAGGPVPGGRPYAKGKVIKATRARLQIGDIDVEQPIAKDACSVDFRVALKAGKTRMQTWFTDKASNSSRGAYFVYVKPLPK